MAKYGWKKGQGVRLIANTHFGHDADLILQLGATESGILNPLTVSQAAGTSGKKVEAPTGFGNRGNIVSDIKDSRAKEDKEKYGEPSRIIMLRNMVGRNDVDEELPTEIGESYIC